MVETRFQECRWVRELTVTVTYSDTTAAIGFKLPKGARIIDWIVNVKTAFAGGTTTLDVGIRGNTDYFIDGLAVNVVGRASPSVLVPGYEITALMDEVWAVVGAGNSAGELDLTCLFSLEQNAGF